jgi:nitrite reductase/ring-hydroxylating ferredoxin subunit
MASAEAAGTDTVNDRDGAWTYLCETAALVGFDGVRVEIADHPPLAVFKVGPSYYVTDDTCTHGAASLADGYLHGCEIECPYHSGRFDVRTGAATTFPCVDALAVYPAEVRNNAVYARLKAP